MRRIGLNRLGMGRSALVWTALAACVAFAPGCPPPGPGTYTLENDALRVEVAGASGAFLSIFNKRTNQELIALHDPGDTQPPWRLRRTPVPFLFPSDTRSYTSVTVTPSAIPGGDALDVVWTLAPSDQIVTRLELLDASEELVMTANYVNNGSLYGAALEYPLLEGIGDLSQPGADSFLLSAQFHGLLYRNPFTLFAPGAQNGISGGDYPTAVGGAMQTYAYYTEGVGGFQLAALDPSNTVKNLAFAKNAAN
ncbi:MAG: hypothetical protein KC466_18370, partial [Myxococcales bacterium]|nr:hypothetical protein [Myxococcales bacterium]